MRPQRVDLLDDLLAKHEVVVRLHDGSLTWGTIVGFYRHADYEEVVVRLRDGETVVVRADAVTDAGALLA